MLGQKRVDGKEALGGGRDDFSALMSLCAEAVPVVLCPEPQHVPPFVVPIGVRGGREQSLWRCGWRWRRRRRWRWRWRSVRRWLKRRRRRRWRRGRWRRGRWRQRWGRWWRQRRRRWRRTWRQGRRRARLHSIVEGVEQVDSSARWVGVNELLGVRDSWAIVRRVGHRYVTVVRVDVAPGHGAPERVGNGVEGPIWSRRITIRRGHRIMAVAHAQPVRWRVRILQASDVEEQVARAVEDHTRRVAGKARAIDRR